nr:MAG TPA: hypothetical protein [Caudoviricetes sp.]
MQMQRKYFTKYKQKLFSYVNFNKKHIISKEYWKILPVFLPYFG